LAGFLIDSRFAYSPNQTLQLTVMLTGELSILELYMPYSGGPFLDVSQYLEFFLKKKNMN
jgi:hypothetical protein